jgi:hypothetical protein
MKTRVLAMRPEWASHSGCGQLQELPLAAERKASTEKG